MSGSILSWFWPLQSQTESKIQAFALSKIFGAKSSKTEDVLAKLYTVPAIEIAQKSYTVCIRNSSTKIAAILYYKEVSVFLLLVCVNRCINHLLKKSNQFNWNHCLLWKVVGFFNTRTNIFLYKKFFFSFQLFFRPVIEKVLPAGNQPRFLTSCPIDKFMSGDYNKGPHLLGFTSLEALFFPMCNRCFF